MTREEAIIILDCERPYGNCGCGASDEEIEDAIDMAIKALGQERLTNKEWIDLLSEQFDVSRTSARDMLHAMMSVKKEDNFKKQFNKPTKSEEIDEAMQEEEER